MNNHFKAILLIITAILIKNTNSIWPRPYKVDLNERNYFDLSEEISSDDEDDIYDPNDEMIKDADIERFNIKRDDDKHYRIHQTAIRRNKKSNENIEKPARNNFQLNETNIYDDMEPEPFIGEFVDRNGTRINSDVYHFDEIVKRMSDNVTKEKRQDASSDEDYDANYDYSRFKAEYDADQNNAIDSKNTFNYTDIKEKETVDDAVKAIADFEKPKNCTKEEMKGIGIKAAKCFLSDLKRNESPKQRASIIRRLITYILIWIAVYVLIAIPCWCQNGWCCCCCICPLCYPKERIDQVKKFIVDNPIGVFHENGVVVHYKPTPYEKYVQKSLEKYIMKI